MQGAESDFSFIKYIEPADELYRRVCFDGILENQSAEEIYDEKRK